MNAQYIDNYGYFFPDESLNEKETIDLVHLIDRKIVSLSEQEDRYSLGSVVDMEFTQDIVEQARDILLQRGYAFSKKDQAKMHFLTWETESRAGKGVMDFCLLVKPIFICWAALSVLMLLVSLYLK